MKTYSILSKCLLTLLCVLSLLAQANAFYDPNLGRWINRDPVGDQAFIHVLAASQTNIGRFESVRQSPSIKPPYRFLRNSPVDNYDYLGLWTASAGGQAQFGFLVGGQISFQLSLGYSRRNGWSCGCLFAPGLGAGGPASMSAGVYGQVTNAESVGGLKELGGEVGGSVTLGPGAGPSVGGDFIFGDGYMGGQACLGAGFGLPGEIHALGTWTAGWDSDRGLK